MTLFTLFTLMACGGFLILFIYKLYGLAAIALFGTLTFGAMAASTCYQYRANHEYEYISSDVSYSPMIS